MLYTHLICLSASPLQFGAVSRVPLPLRASVAEGDGAAVPRREEGDYMTCWCTQKTNQNVSTTMTSATTAGCGTDIDVVPVTILDG